MSVTLRWSGLDELKTALRNLPAELREEAGSIAENRAEAAANDLIAQYHTHDVSGNLADRVTVSRDSGEGLYGVRVVVKSTAKHAWIFENGSQARHYFTKNGVRHATGKAPATNLFVPTMQKHRRVLYTDWKAMLTRHGLKVSGDA